MDMNTILIISAVAGGLYLLLTVLEKILIKKKSKATEVIQNDDRTSNGTDTVTENQ